MLAGLAQACMPRMSDTAKLNEHRCGGRKTRVTMSHTRITDSPKIDLICVCQWAGGARLETHSTANRAKAALPSVPPMATREDDGALRTSQNGPGTPAARQSGGARRVNRQPPPGRGRTACRPPGLPSAQVRKSRGRHAARRHRGRGAADPHRVARHRLVRVAAQEGDHVLRGHRVSTGKAPQRLAVPSTTLAAAREPRSDGAAGAEAAGVVGRGRRGIGRADAHHFARSVVLHSGHAFRPRGSVQAGAHPHVGEGYEERRQPIVDGARSGHRLPSTPYQRRSPAPGALCPGPACPRGPP